LKKFLLANYFIISCVFLILTGRQAAAQSSFAQLNPDYYHLIDRYELKAGHIYPHLFTSIKPYKRSDIVNFIASLNTGGFFTSKADAFNRDYLLNDNWEFSSSEGSASNRPLLKHFYKKKSDFYSVHSSDFDLHVNPVLYWSAGKDSQTDDPLYTNTRGVEVRGMVDQKVGFYAYLADNQALLPAYVRSQVSSNGVIPHEGFWKGYKGGNAYDFLQARGYITFEATKHINIQFGHDHFFIGNGYRSLILSDFSPPALFLKGNVKVWKLNYLFMVSQLTADTKGSASGLNADGGFPQKYSALHHLSINIGRKLNVGIFESVIFNASDSSSNRFRFDYLNPIIFYRAVEQQNGSTDNVLLGMDFKWNAVRKLSFYGQFTLDEFVISHIRAQDGWWANKFGIQLGGKYVDAFGISNLDLQGEVNVVRPFTYSHHTVYGSYSNYRQPLAHPLGANFKEITGILRYQPLPRLNLTGKISMIQTGIDSTGVNWGGNILKLNPSRTQEFNNKVGQGINNDILFATFTASWQLKHNLFIDGSVIIRKSTTDIPVFNSNSTITSLGLRLNIPQRLYEF
jgi:hypothetical protein